MNLDSLWDAADGDADFARELAALYCTQITAQLVLLRAALDEHSAPRVQSIAHHCKGSSHTCGAATLAALFGELVRLAAEGRLDHAQRVTADAELEFARVQAILADLSPRSLPGAPA